MASGGGGSRYLSGRKLDPIRNDFELIKTPENMGKSPQQQQVRCKACAECVSARLERMWEHKDRCRNYFNVIFRITRFVILKNWSYWTKHQRGYNGIVNYSHILALSNMKLYSHTIALSNMNFKVDVFYSISLLLLLLLSVSYNVITMYNKVSKINSAFISNFEKNRYLKKSLI